jgi:hypothetical protein
MAAFCRQENIRASLFYVWNRRLRDADAPAAFVEAKPAGVRGRLGSVQIRLRGGRRLIVRDGFDHLLLAEVVAVMEELP